jgi:hypothetical protein
MPSSRSGDHTRQSSTDRRGYSLSSPAQEQATKSGMLTYDELIAPPSFSNSAPHTILDRETGREESRFSSEQSMNCSDRGANSTTDETTSQQHQLDEAFINSEWETYLMSTDQPCKKHLSQCTAQVVRSSLNGTISSTGKRKLRTDQQWTGSQYE